ncbi:MAG: HD domain-containing phosphohydrolase [Longimicrobiales bacterium]
MNTTAISVGSLDMLIEQGRALEQAGSWSEALEAYETAFQVAVTEPNPRRQTEILRWIGTVYRERGDLEHAQELYEASRAVAQAHGLTDQVASAINSLAAIEQLDGRPQQAETLYRRARDLAEEAGDHTMVGLVEQNLGMLANIRGDVRGALSSYRSALERARRAGDSRAAIAALNNMGMAHVDLDQLGDAQRSFDEAFELASSARDTFSLGYIQLNRAELYLKRQQYEQARQCCDDGFGIFNRLESKTGLAEAYKFYGVIYRETGKVHLADIHLNLSHNLAVLAQNRLLQAEVQHELARVHMEERRNRDAILSLNAAHRLFKEMQARREMLDIEEQITELEETYLHVVARWGTEAIEGKDPYTLGHSRRVADYAARLAVALGIDGHDLSWLKVGAFLHDVGKTVVPSSVLTKGGALSDDEWDLMRRHSIVGDQIVTGLDLPYDVAPLVRHHHERWDGEGYPDRLAGEGIPLLARVLTVADVYDALTTERHYRGAFEPSQAIRILRTEAGRSLDPSLVPIFERDVFEPLTAAT